MNSKNKNAVSQFKRDPLCCLAGFILIRLFLFIPACLSAAESKGPNIVARTDFSVSQDWRPPMILGREFWNMLPSCHPSQDKAMLKFVASEPMVREAATYYSIFLTDETNRLFVSADKLQLLNPDPAKPFLVGSRTRPLFVCLDNFKVDKKGYLEWKKNHPNFLGFDGVSEWDNDYSYSLRRFGRNTNDVYEYYFRPRGCSQMAISRMGNIVRNESKNRNQALAGLHECYLASRNFHFDDPSRLIALRGGWCLDHHALEWGSDMIIMETTMVVPFRHQISMFFARGAAHQYTKPWEWYIAVCCESYDEDGTKLNTVPYYTTDKKSISNGTLGPGYGPSVSLNRRDKYLGYLTGASIVQHETWPYTYCQYQSGTNAAVWELSPHGEAMKEWYAFTQRYPERGISYAPVALLVPFNQGYPCWGGSPWSYFPVERPDTMIDAFMYTLVPPNFPTKEGNEGFLSNNPYGDIYDVLVPNLPSGPIPLKTLMNYKVAIMLGGYNIDRSLGKRLMEYVNEGGTLVINTKQTNMNLPESFFGVERKSSYLVCSTEGEVKSLINNEKATLPEPYGYERITLKGAEQLWTDKDGHILASINQYGKGKVILTTVDWMVPQKSLSGGELDNNGAEWGLKSLLDGKKMPLVKMLMRQVVKEVLPVEVKGDVEYGLNRVADGWWVYLINNKGVIKFARTAEKLDPVAIAKVEVDMRNLHVAGVRELREEKDIAWDHDKNSFSINVGPGDIRIVKITLR